MSQPLGALCAREISLRSELHRSFNRQNLITAALVTVSVTAPAAGLGAGGVLPDFSGLGWIIQALLAGVAAGLAITLLHAAMHAYFGWRFGRGVQAVNQGRDTQARRLLTPAASWAMHYDPAGLARAALERAGAK